MDDARPSPVCCHLRSAVSARDAATDGDVATATPSRTIPRTSGAAPAVVDVPVALVRPIDVVVASRGPRGTGTVVVELTGVRPLLHRGVGVVRLQDW